MRLRDEDGFMLVETVIAAAIGLLIATVLGLIMVSSAKSMASSVLYHRARGALDEATARLTVDTRAATTAPVVSAGGTQVVIGSATWRVVGGKLQRNGVEIVPAYPKMSADYDAPPFSYDGVLHFQLEVDTAYTTVHENTAIAGPVTASPTASPTPSGPLTMTACPTNDGVGHTFEAGASDFWYLTVTPVFSGSVRQVEWDFHDPRPSADDRFIDTTPGVGPWRTTYTYPSNMGGQTAIVDITVYATDTNAVPDRVERFGCQYAIA